MSTGLFLFLLIVLKITLRISAVDTWLTTCDSNGNTINLLAAEKEVQSVPAHNNETRDVNLNVNSNIKLQPMFGFGAGLPQSSALSLTNLKLKSTGLYWEVLSKLFSNDNNGANINILRFPIGSCDFSMTNTSYDEQKGDFSLSHFRIDDDSLMIVEVLQDVMKVNPNMILMGSPWSAPSWLKTMDSLIGLNQANTLINDEPTYDTYAHYFLRVLDVFEAAGLKLSYLTVQNEPLFGDNREYPGMFLSAENAARLIGKIKALVGDRVKVLAYDHNWDHPEYPLEVIRRQGAGVAGTAWHCYGGDMARAHDEVHAAYPALEQHVTECTGSYPDNVCDISQGMTGFGWNHEWDMSNVLLGATSHWAQSGVKWMLALDENCGPVLPDVTFRHGRPLVSIPSFAKSMDDIKFNQDYWSIAHMSRFVLPGAHRVASTLSDSTNLISESFVNPAVGSGGKTITTMTTMTTTTTTTIAMNTNKEKSVALTVKASDGQTFSYTLPPFSTAVFQW